MNYKKLFSSFVFSFVLIISFFSIAGVAKADPWPLVGWGWSSTLGHISFSCNNTAECPQSTYGVNLDSYTGDLSGYAWSSTVGWIQFQGDATHETPRVTDWGTGKMVGWARACVGTVNGLCTGAARTDGWDGWIKLSDSELGVASNFTSPMLDGSKGITFKAGGTFAGYAWGDVNMGWMTFGNVRSSTNTQLPTVELIASPTSVESGGNTTLTWTPTNANACTASTTNDTWTGVKSFSNGTYTETRSNLTGTFPKTYSITCSNQFGSDTATAKVYLTSPSVSPSSPPGGPTFTLSPKCTPTRVELTWGAVSGATGYTISRSDTYTGNYGFVATINNGSVVSYTDNTVATSKDYWYRVVSTGSNPRTYGPTKTTTLSCGGGTPSTTDVKMWITPKATNATDTEDISYTTIKAGETFTIKWDEVGNTNIVDFASCIGRISENGSPSYPVTRTNPNDIFYTSGPMSIGEYIYTMQCQGIPSFPGTYTAKVYKANSATSITTLTVKVKSSKINEQ